MMRVAKPWVRRTASHHPGHAREPDMTTLEASGNAVAAPLHGFCPGACMPSGRSSRRSTTPNPPLYDPVASGKLQDWLCRGSGLALARDALPECSTRGEEHPGISANRSVCVGRRYRTGMSKPDERVPATRLYADQEHAFVS